MHFNRLVSHDRARLALNRLINSHFNNRPGEHARFSIPANADDDDIVLSDYIEQQELLQYNLGSNSNTLYVKGIPLGTLLDEVRLERD
jgi:hypothetical protein